MKRIPTDDMKVVITGDNRVVKTCALGQQEEPLFSKRHQRLAEINRNIDAYEAAIAKEEEKEFAFVDGDGHLIRIAELSPTEARFANLLMDCLGSDRRWMEISEV